MIFFVLIDPLTGWRIEPVTEPHAPPPPLAGEGREGASGHTNRSRGRPEETQLAGEFEDARPRAIAAPGHDQGRADYLVRGARASPGSSRLSPADPDRSVHRRLRIVCGQAYRRVIPWRRGYGEVRPPTMRRERCGGGR